MSRIVISVSPRVTVDRLIRLLSEHNIGGAPVVNTQGRPIGMVSRADTLVSQAQARHRQQLVRDVMSLVAVSVPETLSVPRAAAVLSRHHLRRAPVINQRGTITGVVTSGDILKWVAQQEAAANDSPTASLRGGMELVSSWAFTQPPPPEGEPS